MSKILTVVIMLSFSIFTAAEAQDQIHQNTLKNVKLSLWYNGISHIEKTPESLESSTSAKLNVNLDHILDRIEN